MSRCAARRAPRRGDQGRDAGRVGLATLPTVKPVYPQRTQLPFFDDELPDRTQRLIWELIEVHEALAGEVVTLLGTDNQGLSVAEHHAATQAGLSCLIAAQLCRRSDANAAEALQDLGAKLVFKETQTSYSTAVAAMSILEGVLRATSILGLTPASGQLEISAVAKAEANADAKARAEALAQAAATATAALSALAEEAKEAGASEEAVEALEELKGGIEDGERGVGLLDKLSRAVQLVTPIAGLAEKLIDVVRAVF